MPTYTEEPCEAELTGPIALVSTERLLSDEAVAAAMAAWSDIPMGGPEIEVRGLLEAALACLVTKESAPQEEGQGERRPREITHRAEYLAGIAGTMEYPDFTMAQAQIVLDAIEAAGEEVAPHGTREQIEKLTVQCPDCDGEVGGGGGNSDEPEWTCSTCVGGRVPASTPEGQGGDGGR